MATNINKKKKDDCCCGKTVTETNTTVTEYGTNGCHMPKGTLQYIGARYLPVFADPVEWSADRPYEHLMMVQHQGNTYISKQAVPVGIPLPTPESSNDYWVLLSDWNAQIEQYRQEVELLVQQVSDYKEEVDELETLIGQKPILLLIGDSWCATNPTQPERSQWYNKLPAALNCELKNYAVGAMGYTVGNTPFSTQLANATAALTADEKKRVKWIVCVGGINDANQGKTVTDVNTAAIAMVDGYRTNYPNAIFYIAPNMSGISYHDSYNPKPAYRAFEYANEFKKRLCKRENPCIVGNTHLFGVCEDDSYIYLDNLHLNDIGGRLFLTSVIEMLKGNTTYTPRYDSETTDGVLYSNADNYRIRGHIKYSNGVCSLSQIIASKPTDVNWPDDQIIKLEPASNAIAKMAYFFITPYDAYFMPVAKTNEPSISSTVNAYAAIQKAGGNLEPRIRTYQMNGYTGASLYGFPNYVELNYN